MNAFQQAFDALRALVLGAQTEYSRVLVGALPPDDSMVMAVSAGAEENTSLDLPGALNLDIVLNAKHREQDNVMAALFDVHTQVPRMMDLPRGNGWQILSVSTSSAPSFIEYDGDQWLYGSALEVHISID